ncbi:MAG: hypothetical protein V4437_00045 [Patescibacteria group bacterium]
MQKIKLQELYIKKRMSVAAIASLLGCSQGRINYWLQKHSIQKRTISDASYLKWNPNGNPFSEPVIKDIRTAFLYGLGLGLYWGEGTKSNKVSVRLGNTDPELIKKFLEFLTSVYKIDKSKIHFGLQIFSDMSPKKALSFWCQSLKTHPSQFYKKIVITPSRGVGTYTKKIPHGVITVYFNNKKLRDTICQSIKDIDGVLSELKPM